MRKSEDRDECNLINHARHLQSGYDDFQMYIRNMCKHEDLTGKNPNDLAQEIKDKFHECFYDWSVRSED